MTREEGVEVFRQFLKDNGAYEAWIERTHSTVNRRDYSMSHNSPSEWIDCAFIWSGSFNWGELNTKWRECVRQNNL